MDCKNVYPKKTDGMINHLEIFPQELHIFWNADFDKSAVESKTFPDENETQSSNVKMQSIFHAMWLRDNDQGPLSRHPGNGQRLFNIVDIPEDLYIKSAVLVANDQDSHIIKREGVSIQFGSMDGDYSFEAVFGVEFLQSHDYCNNITLSYNSWEAELLMSKIKLSGETNINGHFRKSESLANSGIKHWDKNYFQDLHEENDHVENSFTNSSFKNGLKFHNYEKLKLLNTEWRKDYSFMNTDDAKARSLNDRRSKFRPLFDFLKDFVEYGFMLLEGIPVKDGELLKIPSLFDGYVRETNYGPLFDVRAKKNPNNLAFTNLKVTPHTDNPYRNPVPSIQILHCLKNECEGGKSGLVDGFWAAEKIRRMSYDIDTVGKGSDSQKVNYFQLLSSNYIPYEYHNPSYIQLEQNDEQENRQRDRAKSQRYSYDQQCARLRHRQPVIEVDDRGKVVAVSFNNRSASAFDFQSCDTTGKSIMPAYYKAYRKMAEILFHDEMQLNIKLKPGQAMIFDNRRVLHARTSFSMDSTKSPNEEDSPRHFQGCYSDKDAVFSKYLLMKENLGLDTILN